MSQVPANETCYTSRKLLNALIQVEPGLVTILKQQSDTKGFCKPRDFKYRSFAAVCEELQVKQALEKKQKQNGTNNCDSPKPGKDEKKKKKKVYPKPSKASLAAKVFNTGTDLKRTSWVQKQLLIPRKQRKSSILLYSEDMKSLNDRKLKQAEIEKAKAEEEKRQERKKRGEEHWKKWVAEKAVQKRVEDSQSPTSPESRRRKVKDWKEDSESYIEWKTRKLKIAKERRDAKLREEEDAKEKEERELKEREARAIKLQEKLMVQRKRLANTSSGGSCGTERKRILKTVQKRMKPYEVKLTKGENIWDKTRAFSAGGSQKPETDELGVDAFLKVFHGHAQSLQLLEHILSKLGSNNSSENVAMEHLELGETSTISVEIIKKFLNIPNSPNVLPIDEFQNCLKGIQLDRPQDELHEFLKCIQEFGSSTTEEVCIESLQVALEYCRKHQLQLIQSKSQNEEGGGTENATAADGGNREMKATVPMTRGQTRSVVFKRLCDAVDKVRRDTNEGAGDKPVLDLIMGYCIETLGQDNEHLSLIQQTLESMRSQEHSLLNMEPLPRRKLKGALKKHLKRIMKADVTDSEPLQRLKEPSLRESTASPAGSPTPKPKVDLGMGPEQSLSSLPSILERARDIRTALVYSSEERVHKGKFSSGFSLEGNAYPNHQAHRLQAKYMKLCAALSTLHLAKGRDVKALLSIEGFRQDQMRVLGGICMAIGMVPRWKLIREEIECWQRSRGKRGGLLHSLANVGTEQEPEVLQELRRTARQISRGQLKYKVLEVMFDWLSAYVELIAEVKRQNKKHR